MPAASDPGPEPDPLDAGSISAVAGDTEVTISQSVAPSGGSGSYSRQLYRSTSGGSKGSAVSGATSLPYDDTGLSNGTEYFYTLDVSDGVSTASTSQVSATPEADDGPPSAADLFPNLQIGGLTQLGYNDGSVRDSGGSAFGIAGFSGWGTDASDNPNAITVDSSELSADNPSGSGSALLMRYVPNADPLCGITSIEPWSTGARRYLCVGTVQRWLSSTYAPNSWTRGHKNYYVGNATTGGTGPTDYWREWQNPGQYRVTPQGGPWIIDSADGPPLSLGGEDYPLVLDTWHTIEEIWVANTAAGNDGEFHVWINGVQIASRTGISWGTTGWNGMEWYAQINDIPSEQWQMLGALYIAVKN